MHALPARRRATTLAVGVTVAAIALAGMVTAGSADAKTVASTPTISLTVTSKSLGLHGKTRQRAGYVTFAVKAKGADQSVALVKLTKGHSYSTFTKNITKAQRGDLPALKRALKDATLLGGIELTKGHSGTFTEKLTRGTYYVYDDSGSSPRNARKITVSGSVRARHTPKVAATVKMTRTMRFTGSTVLPRHGTILVKNTAKRDPSMLTLLQVKPGTTRAQVLDTLQRGTGGAAPSWALSATAGTNVIAGGHQQTLRYSLPKGTYVGLSAFPDLKTGVPQAAMGMVKIFTLK